MRSEIPDITTWNLGLWIMRRRVRFRVAGNSMLPLFQPDEQVLVDLNAYPQIAPAIADIVVLRHPHQLSTLLIKRVVAVDRHEYCFVQGDNLSESTDSRNFGWLPRSLILGQVVSRF